MALDLDAAHLRPDVILRRRRSAARVRGVGRARLYAAAAISVVAVLAVPGMASALSWSGPTALTNPVTQPPLYAVTCISPTVCVAVGSGADEATFNPTNIGGVLAKPLATTGLNGAPSLQAVVCPTASQCTAVGNQGDVMTFNPSTRAIIKNKNMTGAGTGFYDVACPSTSVCVAGDTAGYMYRFDPTTGTDTKRSFDASTAEFNGIACGSSTQCTGVNQIGIEYTFNPMTSPLPKPTQATLTSNADPLQGVACLTSAECVAGDQNGNVQTFDPASATPKSTLKTRAIDPGNELFGMSCATATFCATVDGTGNAYEGIPATGPFHHDVLPGVPSNVNTITCPTTFLCVAVDLSGNVYVGGGRAWKLQSTPTPTGAKSASLAGVACASATACIAVGDYVNSQGVRLTLAERWNGTTWALQTTPNRAGATTSLLSDVACTAATACTAVGHYLNGVGTYLTLAERWNGTAWALQSTPNPTGAKGSSLNGVACTSATACTAVGNVANSAGTQMTLVERWNGTAWTLHASPNPSGATGSFLTNVACPAASACDAVGCGAGAGTAKTLAENWDGTTWTIPTTPNPAAATVAVLNGVTCQTATLCIAVGGASTSGGISTTLAERYS